MTSTVQTVAARQPFAPIDRSRLHRLTSIKNRQNGQNALPSTPTTLNLKGTIFEADNDSTSTAIKHKAAIFEADDDSTSTTLKLKAAVFEAKNNSIPTSIKRKAATFEADGDNSENIDPALLASPKRVRGDGLALTNYSKPTTSHLVLTKASSSQNEVATCGPVKQIISRPINPIKSVNSSSIDPVKQVISGSIKPIKSVNSRSIDPIKSANSRSIDSIKSANSRPIDPIKSANSRSIDPIKSITSRPIDPIKSVNSRPIDPVKQVISRPIDPIKSVNSRPIIPRPILHPRSQASKPNKSTVNTSLHEPLIKASWFFDIHEETIAETMTNVMEHSTNVLDINNDDESRQESRGKENEPPADDVSQTSSGSPRTRSNDGEPSLQAGLRRRETDPDAIEVDREALGDLAPRDFYPDGVSERDVVYVFDDEDEETQVTLDDIMQESSSTAGHAAVFGPLEKAEEGFEIWESQSAKDEDEGDN